MIAALCVFMALSAVPTHEQDSQSSTPLSPCPNVFMYEPPGTEYDMWYGVVQVSTDSTLYSLRLNIVLDSEAAILGNWVGDVTTEDNLDFQIDNRDMKIYPGPATAVRLFVQYNPMKKIPRVQIIRLNGRDICDANRSQPVVDQPDIGLASSRPDTDVTRPEASSSQTTSNPNTDIRSTTPVQERPTELVNSIPLGIDSHLVAYNNPKNRGGQEQCGKVVLNHRQSVLEGKTLEGQWPWHIAIYETESSGIRYICGGTLVSHRHVITAAHCVTRRNSLAVNKNVLTVYLGKHNLRTSVEGVQIKFVRDIILHPDFNVTVYSRNVAILELRDPVSYSEWVRPACLWPEKEIDLTNVIGKSGTVVGWSYEGTGTARYELSLLEMQVVSQDTCIRSYSDFFLRFTSDYTYCAGFRDGTSHCNGESGGGMVFRSGDTWYLRGLVSLSVARQNEYLCDPTHYVIFADLAKLLPWIKQIVNDF